MCPGVPAPWGWARSESRCSAVHSEGRRPRAGGGGGGGGAFLIWKTTYYILYVRAVKPRAGVFSAYLARHIRGSCWGWRLPQPGACSVRCWGFEEAELGLWAPARGAPTGPCHGLAVAPNHFALCVTVPCCFASGQVSGPVRFLCASPLGAPTTSGQEHGSYPNPNPPTGRPSSSPTASSIAATAAPSPPLRKSIAPRAFDIRRQSFSPAHHGSIAFF
jgi:hypothetical protein